jgi:hypothetical protein
MGFFDALGVLAFMIMLIVSAYLVYDYRGHRTGPKEWWRFWVTEPTAPAVPTPATTAPKPGAKVD